VEAILRILPRVNAPYSATGTEARRPEIHVHNQPDRHESQLTVPTLLYLYAGVAIHQYARDHENGEYTNKDTLQRFQKFSLLRPTATSTGQLLTVFYRGIRSNWQPSLGPEVNRAFFCSNYRQHFVSSVAWLAFCSRALQIVVGRPPLLTGVRFSLSALSVTYVPSLESRAFGFARRGNERVAGNNGRYSLVCACGGNPRHGSAQPSVSGRELGVAEMCFARRQREPGGSRRIANLKEEHDKSQAAQAYRRRTRPTTALGYQRPNVWESNVGGQISPRTRRVQPTSEGSTRRCNRIRD